MRLPRFRFMALALLLGAVTPAAAPAPIIRLSFDEGSAAALKDSAGAVPVEYAGAFTNGKSGGAVWLDGTAAKFVSLKAMGDKQFGKASFTLAFWANPTSLAIEAKDNRRRLFGLEAYPKQWTVLDVRSTGLLEFQSGYKDGETMRTLNVKGKTPLAENRWTHVALVVDRSARKATLYLDGQADASAPIENGWDPDLVLDKPMTLGSSWQNFKGALDEFKLWRAALGAQEIAAEMKAAGQAAEGAPGAGGPDISLSFEEGSGKAARDARGAAAIVNAQWAAGWSGYGVGMKGDSKETVALALPRENQIGLSSFTFSCRAKIDDFTAPGADKRRRLAALVDNWPAVYGVIDVLEDGTLQFETGAKTDTEKMGLNQRSQAKLTPKKWAHIAMVFDRGAGKLRWYVDGAPEGEGNLGTAAGIQYLSDKPLTIGSSWQNIIGSVDEVRLWKRALSADEIASESRAVAKPPKEPKVPSGPTGYTPRTRTQNLKAAATYYVAPDGDDRFTGTLPAPNAQKSDGPFASVNGALEMIRGLRAKGQGKEGAQIVVKNGTYRVSGPILLTPDISGTPGKPLRIVAETPGAATLSGGRPITGWTKVGERWQTTIPAVKSGEWYFKALWVGGERAQRSRHPNTGFFRPESNPKDAPNTALIYKPGDVNPQWANFQDIDAWVYHSWTASVHGLALAIPGERRLVFQNPSGYPFGKWGDARYYFENVREALDAPGEWYLDRTSGVLSYLPKPGEDPNKLEVIAPFATRLIDVQGDPKAGAYVEHLEVSGLRFLHTDRDFDPTEKIDGQAFVGVRKAMFWATGLKNASFTDCEFSHGNLHAIWIEKGCFDVALRQCHIYDHGGGGVYIGDTGYSPDPGQRTERITVDNSFIHKVNLILHGAHGVWIGKSSFNKITHNEISDLDYSPIGAGWTWGFNTPSGVQGNLFEHNHLHHFGLGELSDMAGIYTLGISPGTVERYNHVHDVWAYSYGGWGLYTDEGSSDVLLEKNLVYNTKSGGFHQHYGSNNLIRNNIFAFAAEGNVISKRGDDKNKSFIFERNIVLTTNSFAVNKGFKNPEFRFDKNLYWDLKDASTSNYSFSGITFPEWQAEEGFDKNGRVADPLFENAAKYDFRLKAGSPAAKLGFEPFLDEIAKAGLYGAAEWTRLPARYTPRGVNPDTKPPEAPKATSRRSLFAEDFDAIAPGVPPSFGGYDAGILTDGTHAKGTYSLKFQDDVNLGPEWKPHLNFANKFLKGRLKASFDLWMEDEAIFWHEWRETAGNPYRIGPSFKILADGSLEVDKRKLASFPKKKWLHVEMSAMQDGKPAGTWDLAITPEGGAREEWSGLRNGSADWAACEMIIWSAMAQARTALWLDNLKYEVEKTK